MNDDMTHEPSPEFCDSLEREIQRELRRERVFGAADDRRVHIGRVIGLAAGAVMTLTIGLVLGASTGYASAEVIIKERGGTPLPPASGLAVLKNIPPLVFSCPSVPPAVVAAAPAPQQGIPIVELPAAQTKSAISLGSVLGLRELPNGNVLVNDAGRRQMRLMDSTLTSQTIVRDSTPGSANSYGTRPVPLIRYLGDSSLLVDGQAGSMLLMNPSGQVARTIAPSHSGMMQGLALHFGGVDQQGRIVFQAGIRDFGRGLDRVYDRPDSAVIVRADLETRGADTLARLKTWPSTMMINNGTGVTRFSADPLPLIDEWTMLSDGAMAVVRGHDYHIDWILPDGSTRAAPKMPFDWKRLTDEDKQKLIDSTRDAASPELAMALGRRRVGDAPPDGARGGRGAGGTFEQGPPRPVEYVPPKLSEMFDFQPPIRRGALMPDLDGNLWILPSTSAQSKNGELVYDVTNPKGEFRRVRIPAGRSVIGFGKGGAVYLLSGDKTNGFVLEKTRMPRAKYDSVRVIR